MRFKTLNVPWETDISLPSSSYLGRKEKRRLWQLNHLLDLPGLESSKYMLRWLLLFFLLPQDKWVGAFSSTQRFCSVELKAFLTTTKKQSAQWSWCCQQNTNCFELLALSLSLPTFNYSRNFSHRSFTAKVSAGVVQGSRKEGKEGSG